MWTFFPFNNNKNMCMCCLVLIPDKSLRNFRFVSLKIRATLLNEENNGFTYNSLKRGRNEATIHRDVSAADARLWEDDIINNSLKKMYKLSKKTDSLFK